MAFLNFIIVALILVSCLHITIFAVFVLQAYMFVHVYSRVLFLQAYMFVHVCSRVLFLQAYMFVYVYSRVLFL